MTKPSHSDSESNSTTSKNWWPLIHRLTSIVALVVIGGIAWASLRSQNPQPGLAELEREAEVQTSTVEAQELQTNKTAPSAESVSEPVNESVVKSPEANAPVPDTAPDEAAATNPSVAAEVKSDQSVPEPSVSESKEPEPNEQVATEEESPTATGSEELGPPPKFYDADVAELTFNKTCSQCHKTTRVEKFDFKDLAGVETILTRMSAKMEKKGLAFNEKQRAFLQYYLASTFLK